MILTCMSPRGIYIDHNRGAGDHIAVLRATRLTTSPYQFWSRLYTIPSSCWRESWCYASLFGQRFTGNDTPIAAAASRQGCWLLVSFMTSPFGYRHWDCKLILVIMWCRWRYQQPKPKPFPESLWLYPPWYVSRHRSRIAFAMPLYYWDDIKCAISRGCIG